MTNPMSPIVAIDSVSHRYGTTLALDNISIDLPRGRMVGLIGPDGVGKSTLMGLIAGSKIVQQGELTVLDGDIASAKHRREICPRVAYMPQGLGKNLYAELSVAENLHFFGRLFAQSSAERKRRISELTRATGLDPFVDRPAGKLSGGMKQKLGLCCALIHDPDLLLLDEPTTGVDPLSRQQFWQLIEQIRAARPGMSLLVSTAYMDEADRFDWLIAMHNGRLLSTGTSKELQERTETETLEQAFVALLPEDARGDGGILEIPPREPVSGPPAIEATGLTRRFGSFVAVNDVSFQIEKGEIFGFLGSNGCGKSTTMKMLTGLLAASEGEAKLFGQSVAAESIEIRNRVGYMSQAFSLYGELTVAQNLWLHARLFHLPKATRQPRIDELLEQFGLTPYTDQLAARLPLGVRQRLSLAVAVIQRPEMLILDEPTSGVDPVARDQFWELLVRLSREDKVTIFISTHFMNEALRCDRISLMHAGNVLACDEPLKLVEARGADSLEAAFIEYISEAEGAKADEDQHVWSEQESSDSDLTETELDISHGFSPGRLLAYSYRETLEVIRDPIRLAFAFVGSVVLMFVFGFGITTDVNEIKFATLDNDRSPSSREYVQSLVGTNYFFEQQELMGRDDMVARLQENSIGMAVEIPPHFGRDLERGGAPEVSTWVDGANPSRASTVEGYVKGAHATTLEQLELEMQLPSSQSPVTVQSRFRYNPTFESIYAMVPSIPAILLILIPAILMAVSVVKEKELGSITNFYVTPTSRLEFLLGKQLPYVVIGLANFVLLTLMAVGLFDVPLKGSLLSLVACAAVYVVATTGIGLVISSFTSSQVAAVFVTTVVTILPSLQFSGLLQPVSTLEGGAHWVGTFWPTTYYMHASVGAFTKGLGFASLQGDLFALLAFVPVLWGLAAVSLPKQEA